MARDFTASINYGVVSDEPKSNIKAMRRGIDFAEADSDTNIGFRTKIRGQNSFFFV